LAHTIVMLIQR